MKSTWRLYLVLKVDQKQNCLHVQESLHPKRWLNCVYSKPTRSMVLNPCLGQEGSYELGSVRPSFLWEVVLGLAHLVFLKLRIVLKAHVLLCVTEPGFLKNKSHAREKSGSWNMGQNTVGQSDCRIFELTISLEQNDKKAWFLAYWYRLIKIKGWMTNIWVGIFKNRFGHSRLRTLLAVSQEGSNGMNWFLVCW